MSRPPSSPAPPPPPPPPPPERWQPGAPRPDQRPYPGPQPSYPAWWQGVGIVIAVIVAVCGLFVVAAFIAIAAAYSSMGSNK